MNGDQARVTRGLLTCCPKIPDRTALGVGTDGAEETAQTGNGNADNN